MRKSSPERFDSGFSFFLTLCFRRSHLAFLLLMGSGILGCRGESPEPPAPPAPVQAQAASKTVMGEWTALLGTTQPLPNHAALISAAVEGRVVALLGGGKGADVVEGQEVKPGQIILRLDDRVVRANQKKLAATVVDLEEQAKQAGYALDLATIDVNRLKELRGNKPANVQLPQVSPVELEKAHVLEKDAQSKLKAVASRLTAARADLQALDEQLEFYTLRAPIAGRLSTVQAVLGQTLSPGTVVAQVVDLSEVDVLCYVPPDVVSKLAVGQTAKLVHVEPKTEEGKPDREGKVVFVGVQAQPETGNVPVKLRFPNPDLRLRANVIARVHVLTESVKERLTIPEAAVLEDVEPPLVVAVRDVKTEKHNDEEFQIGKVQKLQAILGIRDRDKGVIEILNLIDPASNKSVAVEGLLFVTSGGHGLQNNDDVKLEKEESKEHE